MKVWFHFACMFESLSRARATTKKIESPADLEGYSDINDEDKEEIKKLIKGISIALTKLQHLNHTEGFVPGKAKPTGKPAGTPKKSKAEVPSCQF